MRTSEFLVWGNNQCSLLAKPGAKCLPTPTRLTIGYQVISLCASEKHISFLTKDGSVYSYGTNLDGRLGVSTKAVDKVGFDAPVKVPLKDKVIRIESGFSHMCALTEKGELYSWGLGDYGALGTGEFKSRSIPTKVQLPRQALQHLRQISCGAMHTAFLTDLGEVYTCGSNQYGELGVNKPEKVSTPLPISFHQDVQQISCGVFYTLLLTKDGRVYGMGNNKYGQLGIGHKVNQCHPTMLRDLQGIIKVSAGYHSGAIDFSGNLYIWGSGSFGEYIKPQKYVLSVPIRDLAIRGFFGLAIGHTSREENRVYTWGNNTFGELAVGNYDAAKQPVEVDHLRGREIGKIVLGVNFAIVLLIGGRTDVKMNTQQFQKIVDEQQLREERYPGETQGRSVVGFEEGYLNSHLKSQEKLSKRGYDLSRSQKRSQEKETYDNLLGKDRERRDLSPAIQQTHRGNSGRDYQKLFVTLSQDYEKLVSNYNALEKQLLVLNSQTHRETTYRNFESHRSQDMKNVNSVLQAEIVALKNEVSKVNFENISLKDELRAKNRVIEDQRFQLDRLQKVSLSPPLFGQPAQSSKSRSLPPEMEMEYNKLLNHKEQIINKLTISINKLEEENTILQAQLKTQKIDITSRLENQKDMTAKIIKEHQILLDELQAQLKKSEQRALILKEQNNMMKKKFADMEDSWREIETFRVKMEEDSQTDRIDKQKYANQLKGSLIQNQVMTERIEQLEIELRYEKQFNKKFQGTLSEANQLKQKLHKELNVQLDINQDHLAKIDALKGEVEKSKKYKKEVDQKNIIIEEQTQKLENYKRKIEEIIGQKDDRIADLQEDIEKKSKQFEVKLRQKDELVEEQHRENNKLEKQICKNKQSISTLKQQLSLQQNQIQNLTQSKTSLEKKVSYLNNQLTKQVNEREQLIVALGETKRELAKLKISYGEMENKYIIEKQQKQKLAKQMEIKEQLISRLEAELAKSNEKCGNLQRQNEMYRRELQEAQIKIQEQQKVNDELAEANKQFAEAEREFQEKIKVLESRVYELEDQNKSYTPRYEALILRNKELDQRNRELSEMINKAIQIQAENYKTNILKEVETNTGKFIDQVKEEQEFKSKNRRNRVEQKQEVKEFENDDNFKSPPMSMIKEEPYTREVRQRLSTHKRKVSESANKLASLLDIDEGLRGDRRNLGIDSRRTDDLEKLNFQMDSFNNQKSEFMSKIQSFAEKLKIL